jgi:sulfite reductase (NADPH) flavoprotein alpha-component
VARLPYLPQREYSIASVPDTGRVSLLVRQLRLDKGRLGLGSGWLTAHAAMGSSVQMRIRENAAFHVPAVDCPCILIGNGTGIAGLRAHLAERAAEGRHRNWLLFGERTRAHDYHYQDDIERWHRDGVLTRVDLAFSRDPDDRRYVQDLVRAADEEIQRWVAEGAAIYVCGSLEGMATGVDAALAAALGSASLRDLAAQGRYRRDVY